MILRIVLIQLYVLIKGVFVSQITTGGSTASGATPIMIHLILSYCGITMHQ